MAVFDHVQKIKSDLETDDVKIYVSGGPILIGWIIKHAFEILLYVSLTIATIFGLLWLYFRRWHGVLIPAVAAMMTVVWGLGFTGWMGITFDPLILVIPMIITARAVSHTVQMAERFFEDYEVMLPRYDDPQRGEGRGRHRRHGRADRSRHPRHRHRRRRPARDPRDFDPADAQPRHLRRLLGEFDRRDGGDPPSRS